LLRLLCFGRRVGRPTHLRLDSPNRMQKKIQKNKTAAIAFRTEGTSQANIWRIALLSCNPETDLNVTSQSLVKNVLKVRIESIDRDTAPEGRDDTDIEKVEGFVDLVWRFGNNKKKQHRQHSTRFFVTSDPNPSYDAVLGKTSAMQYGFLTE
jgi:hypothetical protein